MPGLKLDGALLSDRFELIGRIGAGPFAETLVARDIRVLGQFALVRAARLAGSADAAVTARLADNFAQEAETARRIAHPHIVPFLDLGRAVDGDGREFSYLVFEYLAGGDISALARRQPEGRLPLHELTRYARQVAAALVHAHALGVVHGSLRPADLLLSPDERTIKVAGLGAAKIDLFDGIAVEGLQTDIYAAPERHGAERAADGERRSNDIYALAKICFAAVTGQTPVEFVARPIDRLPVAVAAEPWGDGFLRILRRATAASVADRYESVTDFQRELAALAADDVADRAKVERKPSPEEKELLRKRAQLSPLEAVLAQKEMELTTLRLELREFEGRYLRLVGVKHAELDEVEAQLAEANARMFPDDVELRIAAVRARTRAGESAAAAERNAVSAKPCARFQPSERIKQIYRELARLIHPDTVLNPEQKAERHVLMSQVNRAYEENDFGRLQNLLGDWEHSPEAVKGHGPGAELIRTIRKIDQAEERLSLIGGEFAEAERSRVFQLKQETDLARADGRDHLHEMAARIDNRIREGRRSLSELTMEQTVA